MKLRIVYFPHEQKYSIWDGAHNLVKEWFNTREEANEWLTRNEKELMVRFLIGELRKPYPTITAKVRKDSVKPVLEKYLQNNPLVRETLHKATRLQK